MKLPVTPIMMGFCYNPLDKTYYGASMYHNKEDPKPIQGVVGRDLVEVSANMTFYLSRKFHDESIAISEIFESNIFN